MAFDFLFNLLGLHDHFKEHRDYSLKYPRRRKSGWFFKLIFVAVGGYLIYLYLRTQQLLP